MITPADERTKNGPGAFQDVVTVELSDLERRFFALMVERTAAEGASQLGLVSFGSEPAGTGRLTLETVRPLERWRCRFETLDVALEADLEAVSLPIDFGDPATETPVKAEGMTRYEQLCRFTGEIRGPGGRVRLEGVGRRTHAWGERSAGRFRSLYAVSGDRFVTVTAVEPSGGSPHGAELVSAFLVRADAPPEPLIEARLSTIFDATGRPRTAGAELFVEGEEYPHRISGEATGQAQDPSGRVRAASFRWSVDGEPGQGGYQLVSS